MVAKPEVIIGLRGQVLVSRVTGSLGTGSHSSGKRVYQDLAFAISDGNSVAKHIRKGQTNIETSQSPFALLQRSTVNEVCRGSAELPPDRQRL